MCTSPWEKFVERCFEACFRLSVARWAGVFLRLRSVEAIVLGETTDAEKETESGELLKSGSGESLILRRRKGKSRSL